MGSIPRSQMRKPGGGFLCSIAEQHKPGNERKRGLWQGKGNESQGI